MKDDQCLMRNEQWDTRFSFNYDTVRRSSTGSNPPSKTGWMPAWRHGTVKRIPRRKDLSPQYVVFEQARLEVWLAIHRFRPVFAWPPADVVPAICSDFAPRSVGNQCASRRTF